MDQKGENKKNKNIGIAVSIGIHAGLLILFFFVIAWQMPDPPPPGLPGMEINLGFVDAGSGEEQASVDKISEENPTKELEQEEITEEAILTEEKLITSDVPSPYEIKEVDKAKEAKKELVKENKTEQIEAKNSFPNKNSNSDGDKNQKGDQGKPEGNPDSRNMFPGGKGNEKGAGPGGNGASMDLPGWEWDTKPNKVDPTSESGYVLFEFFVDEEGSVISVKKIGGANLTPSEDVFYKKQLLETSFHLKDSHANPAPRTRGIFRFEVRSR
ncbi:MAG TPA: hypothetical protein VK766_02165 [Cytophagaceae bacterium]|jgi:protein TonB|nr:hypothetical protein [Cytophagaceae bacterium]